MHDQTIAATSKKPVSCRQPKRPKPWTIKIHNGGSAQWQLPCTNQITTARRHADKTKLPLSSETIMADQFSNLMNQAITSLRNTKKRRGDDDTDDDSNESEEMETESKKNQDEPRSRKQVCPKAVPRRGLVRVMSLHPRRGKGQKYKWPLAITKSQLFQLSNSQSCYAGSWQENDPGQ